MEIQIAKRTLKVLDFDIENRPLTYLGNDWTTADVTAIAWKWIGSKDAPTVMALGEVSSKEMLDAFLTVYDEAEMVTGHYIRGHDLPTINGALSEFGFSPLKSKLTQDTKIDLIKRVGISGSQESIAAMLGIKSPKIGMSQQSWRKANRLTEEGIKLVKIRVSGDVEQHIEMREELLKRGWLGSPKVWTGGPSFTQYTPPGD